MKEARFAGPVPDVSVSMPRWRLAHPLGTFTIKENGTTLPPVEINYKKTLGWNIGDPRIAALNTVAKLINTPELIQRTAYVAATTIDQSEIQNLSVVDLFQRTLTEDSFTTFTKVLDSKFFTKRYLEMLGLPSNFLQVFSLIAGTGGGDISFAKRVEALISVENLIRLQGPILKAGLSVFDENRLLRTDIEQAEHQYNYGLSPGLRTELNCLYQDVISRYRFAEKLLQELGITNHFVVDDAEIICRVVHEINSGIVNLFNEGEHFETHWRQSSNFEYLGDEGRSTLRRPNGKRTRLFDAWAGKDVVFRDGSVVRTRNDAIKCPFPQFARK